MYLVYHAQRFDKEFAELEFKEQKIIQRFEKRLMQNPYTGKPLYSTFFREKKINGKRAYFLIYEHLQTVILAATSDKKTQQSIINEVKSKLREYAELAQKINKHV